MTKRTVSFADFLPFDHSLYVELRRKTTIRLLILYLGPVLLLSVFFFIQYDSILGESKRLHLQAIAESQANTLDLFLSERVVNLSNLLNDPSYPIPPTSDQIDSHLRRLMRSSDAFVDVGFFDNNGIQIAYAGPFPDLEQRSYLHERWYERLREGGQRFIITDIYLGFRLRPHFTIAVSRVIGDQFYVLRATLEPQKIYDYIRSLREDREVYTSIVNKDGLYQLSAPAIGSPLDTASFVPPLEPPVGVQYAEINGRKSISAHAWLNTVEWALIVQEPPTGGLPTLSGFRLIMLAITIVMSIIGTVIIFFRAKHTTEVQMESDRTRAQLTHAAKLASVGELAAGIAHEINNPLASISEEAGLIQDKSNPAFGRDLTTEELQGHLDSIQQSVYRCRDITHKLLGFVRKHDVDLRRHDIHKLIDSVIDGLLRNELAVSSIKVERDYAHGLPEITTDGNQLQQVFLNIIKNAMDAIGGKAGRISIRTEKEADNILITISDTGKGMSQPQLANIFLPFFTTKEPGKGTGLGLSISYGIVESLGGHVSVKSTLGEGSSFTISLPAK